MTERSAKPAPEEWTTDAELESILALIAPQAGGLIDSNDPASNARIGVHGVGTNCADHYVNEVFTLRDFCWCDGRSHPEDEAGDSTCPADFEHFESGIQGRWYKYLGRDTEFNRAAHAGEAQAVLIDCILSLPRLDPAALKQSVRFQTTAWGWVDPVPFPS